MKDLQHKDLEGLEINIEWGKNSRNFDPEKVKRAPRDKERRADKSDVKCFKCEKKGHFARDCRERRSRSPKRYRDRDDRRRRSRTPDRYDRDRRYDRERRDRYRSRTPDRYDRNRRYDRER